MGREKAVRLIYAPGLDGVRALAVVGVLLFHAGMTWAGGGFVGVSVFFTLSGFLIGSLLIAEAGSTGAVDLKRFWGRRARRLLPGAIVATAMAVALAALVLPAARSSLRGDVLAVLTYVANWRFWLVGRSYSSLFASPSPLLHFWSLAIEEQLNVVLPLIVFVTVRRARRTGRDRLGVVLCSGWLMSTAVAIVIGATGHRDLAYYGTIGRAPELLTGMIVAWLMLARPKRPSRLIDLAGVAGLGVLVVVAATVTTTTAWLYRGGFTAISFASVALVVAATQPFGVVSKVLSSTPLRLLGRISYGIYLYHWPIFLWLTPTRTHLATLPLLAVRLSVTLAVAIVSFALLERPILRGRVLRRGRGAWVSVGGGSVVLASAVLFGSMPTASAAIDFEHFRQQLARGPAALRAISASAGSSLDIGSSSGLSSNVLDAPPKPEASGVPPSSSTTVLSASGALAPAPPIDAVPIASTASIVSARPLHIAVFGDSTGLMTSVGLMDWGASTTRIDVGGAAVLGCPVARSGQVRYQRGAEPVREGCDWNETWKAYVDAHSVDLAVIQFGPWDVSDRRLDGDTKWRQPGDPVYDERLASEMTAASRVLLAHGVPVIWLSSPTIELGKAEQPPPNPPLPTSDPARMRRFNEIMRGVVSALPGTTIVGLAEHLATLPGGEKDVHLRPDGVHFTRGSADEIATWLGPTLLDAYPALRDQLARQQRAGSRAS